MPKARKPYRCGRSACRKVYYLPKDPLEYVREKRCSCGGHLHDYSVNRKRGNTCLCDGLPYPHRKGSVVWCKHHLTGPTDADYQERYYGG